MDFTWLKLGISFLFFGKASLEICLGELVLKLVDGEH